MNNLNLKKYLEIVNEEKNKRGLNAFIPLYPMLRVENDKLYVCVAIVAEMDNVWNVNEEIIPKYWVLIDPETNNILEFNKTSENNYIIGELSKKNINNKQKELSEFTIKKSLQYKDYLINDIKNEKTPIQKKLATILGEEIEIDGELINVNEYLLANLEEEIKTKIDDLVNVLINSKYGSMTLYYDYLFKQIIKDYRETRNINKDKIKYCIEIMNTYYDGVISIDNLFNI